MRPAPPSPMILLLAVLVGAAQRSHTAVAVAAAPIQLCDSAADLTPGRWASLDNELVHPPLVPPGDAASSRRPPTNIDELLTNPDQVLYRPTKVPG